MRKRKGNIPNSKTGEYLLDQEEKADPGIVFHELFDAYDLNAIRQRLRDVLESALFNKDCDAQSYFFLFRQLEKLVEAAHIIASLRHDDADDEKDEFLNTDDLAEEKFYKPPRFEEIAALRPLEALEKTFSFCRVTDLIDEIEKWKRCVMTGALYLYTDVILREHFWTFCDQLMCLVESAGIYCRDLNISEMKEMESFFAQFTLTYAQRELWDCFEAVVNDQREDNNIDKSNITQTYRCLLSIITATYFLLEHAEPSDSVMMFERKAV